MAARKVSLARLVDVRTGEGLPLVILIAHALLNGCSFLFVETVASALFVANLEIRALPYVYIAVALVSVALGYAYTRAEASAPPLTLLNAVLAVQAIGLVGFYFALLHDPSKPTVMGLMIWKDVNFILGELEFWALTGLVFNVRQAKRLFGVIVGADTLGSIGAGLATPVLVEVLGPIYLLPLAALSVSGCLILLQVIGRLSADRFTHESREEEPHRRSLWQLVRDRYIGLTLVATVLLVAGSYFLEYAFFDRVKERFQTEEAAASFFGLFYTALSTASLLTGSFLTGWLLRRWGLPAALLAAPAVMGGVLAAVIAFGLALGPAGAFVWGIILVKLLHETSSDSIQNPAFRLLYLPLPWVDKLRVQGVRESIVFPLAMGISGMSLVALTSFMQFGAIEVAALTLLLLAAAIYVGWRLTREYVRILAVAVEKRRFGGDGFSLDDAATVAVLERRLLRGHPLEVLYCVRLFEQAGHPELCRILIALVDHPDPLVRQYALERIGVDGCLAALPRVKQCLADGGPAAVRGAALKSLCRLLESDALDLAAAHLEHRDREMRREALVGLLRHGGIDGVLLAGGSFNRLKESRAAEERQAAAEILGEVGIASFYRPLKDLLQDTEASVRRAALSASAQIPNPSLIPYIVTQLADPATRDAALGALVAFEDLAIPALDARFAEEEAPRDERLRLIRVLARIGTAKSVASLVKKLAVPDLIVRHRILTMLAAIKYAAPAREFDTVVEMLRAEVADAVWASAALRDLEGNERTAEVVNALTSEVVKIRTRILAILTFLYPCASVHSARALLYTGTPDQRAQAMEIVDTVISAALRSVVLPALDDLPLARLLDRLAVVYPQPRLSAGERLRDIMTRSPARISGWTRAAALWTAGRLRTVPAELAVQLLRDREDYVRETAAAVLNELDRGTFVAHAEGLLRDASPLVVAAARERAGRLALDLVSLEGARAAARDLAQLGLEDDWSTRATQAARATP